MAPGRVFWSCSTMATSRTTPGQKWVKTWRLWYFGEGQNRLLLQNQRDLIYSRTWASFPQCHWSYLILVPDPSPLLYITGCFKFQRLLLKMYVDCRVHTKRQVLIKKSASSICLWYHCCLFLIFNQTTMAQEHKYKIETYFLLGVLVAVAVVSRCVRFMIIRHAF